MEITAEPLGQPPIIPPLVRYTGPIHLAGNLTVAHSTIIGAQSAVDIVGPILLDQSSSGTPGLTMGDWATAWSVLPVIRGDIHDGPGNASNPMVFRSYLNTFLIAGTHTDYAGDTYIDAGGDRMVDSTADAAVLAGPGVTLGKGDIYLQPGGHLNLSDASNLAAGKSITMASDAPNLAVLGLSYNGVPAISAKSTGVLGIETKNFDAVADLSKLGDGTSALLGTSRGGVFTGNSLAPGAGNLYRLGGGGSNRIRGTGQFVITQPVLVGSAGVEVGSPAWWGNGNVIFTGANTFTGPLTVQGPATPNQYQTFLVSSLEGTAQTAPGASPFGSAQGSVLVDGAILQLTGVPGGQPVAKGALTFQNHAAIQLNGSHGPADLTFSDITRRDNAILTVDSSNAHALGSTERLHINSWNKPLAFVDPYLLCSIGGGIDFSSYDPAAGIVPFKGYVKDLTNVQPDDVLLLNKAAASRADDSCKRPENLRLDHRQGHVCPLRRRSAGRRRYQSQSRLRR